jgi:hypothetical protein
MAEKLNPFPFSVPLKITTPPVRYPPAGRCIYCGTFSNKLQLEHILPFGIAGNSMLFPKASCPTCAKITGQVEQACLRHFWWPLRTRMGAPTGRPKDRPQTFTLRRVTPNGAGFNLIGTSEVSAEEYPLNYVALLLPLPGILAGRQPTRMFEGQFWACYNEAEIRALRQNESEAIVMGPINPNTFARMLAKIGHAYATAENRYRFRPLLLDLILGETDTANYWVGGELQLPPVSDQPILHNISSRRCTVNGLRTYLVVDLQLFAFFQTPLYHVVVGEIERTAN